jgi:hypothetical protein
MTAEIAYRVWYPIKECAQLRGCSEQYIYRLIRNGRRGIIASEFLPTHMVNHNGANLVVHRSFIFPNEPGPTVAPMTPQTDLTDEQIARVVRRTFLEMGLLAERRTAA